VGPPATVGLEPLRCQNERDCEERYRASRLVDREPSRPRDERHQSPELGVEVDEVLEDVVAGGTPAARHEDALDLVERNGSHPATVELPSDGVDSCVGLDDDDPRRVAGGRLSDQKPDGRANGTSRRNPMAQDIKEFAIQRDSDAQAVAAVGDGEGVRLMGGVRHGRRRWRSIEVCPSVRSFVARRRLMSRLRFSKYSGSIRRSIGTCRAIATANMNCTESGR